MTKTNKDQSQIGTPELPFTEAGMKAWKSYDAAQGDYTGSCLPFGLMRSMNSPDPIQIMQNPKYVALLYEQNTWFHIIPIDKPHHDGRNSYLVRGFDRDIGTAIRSWWIPSTLTAARVWIPSAIRTAMPCT